MRASRILRLFLLTSLFSAFASGQGARRIILPNPQLIHCREANCSQLWKDQPPVGSAVYPSQVLTDVVNGEIVGLTAIYDKSVSMDEIRAALNAAYGQWRIVDLDTKKMSVWRVEWEQIAIQLANWDDGTRLIYLKFAKYPDLVPSAHIKCEK